MLFCSLFLSHFSFSLSLLFHSLRCLTLFLAFLLSLFLPRPSISSSSSPVAVFMLLYPFFFLLSSFLSLTSFFVYSILSLSFSSHPLLPFSSPPSTPHSLPFFPFLPMLLSVSPNVSSIFITCSERHEKNWVQKCASNLLGSYFNRNSLDLI